jgi:hypothetical protein
MEGNHSVHSSLLRINKRNSTVIKVQMVQRNHLAAQWSGERSEYSNSLHRCQRQTVWVQFCLVAFCCINNQRNRRWENEHHPFLLPPWERSKPARQMILQYQDTIRPLLMSTDLTNIYGHNYYYASWHTILIYFKVIFKTEL